MLRAWYWVSWDCSALAFRMAKQDPPEPESPDIPRAVLSASFAQLKSTTLPFDEHECSIPKAVLKFNGQLRLTSRSQLRLTQALLL
jgi:hypothetical protein